MKMRRKLWTLGLLTLGVAVLAGCQPSSPDDHPSVRGLRFDVTRSGPVVIGADDDGNPIELTNTPPTLQVVTEDEDCTPVAQTGDLQTTKSTIDIDGTTYETWVLTAGSQSVLAPYDPKCLPTPDGDNYAIVGVAETVHGDGPLDGKAVGYALDERIAEPGDAAYKVIK